MRIKTSDNFYKNVLIKIKASPQLVDSTHPDVNMVYRTMALRVIRGPKKRKRLKREIKFFSILLPKYKENQRKELDKAFKYFDRWNGEQIVNSLL